VGDRPIIDDLDVEFHIERDGPEWQWALSMICLEDTNGELVQITAGGLVLEPTNKHFNSRLAEVIWSEAQLILAAEMDLIDSDHAAGLVMDGVSA